MQGEKTYEMLWDCRYCDTRKLLGLTHRHCPTCGAQQDPTGRYFPSDAEKVAVQDHPFVGADVVCPACSAANGRSNRCCGSCGRSLGDAPEVARRRDQVYASGVAYQGETVEQARAELAPRPAALVAPPPQRSGLGCVLGGVLGAVALVVVGAIAIVVTVLVLGSRMHTAQLVVKSRSWERTIDVVRFGPVDRSAWCDEVPAGARETSRSLEQRSSRQVQRGQDCHTVKQDRGNGTFTEHEECSPHMVSEPVMAERCRYTVDEWSDERTARASGGDSDPPAWPATNLRQGTCEGCEREGTRTESYEAVFDDSGTKRTCAFDRADPTWSALKSGTVWNGQVSALGNVDCGSLSP
jgi:hypothetical protein